jgi:hypothetical protein
MAAPKRGSFLSHMAFPSRFYKFNVDWSCHYVNLRLVVELKDYCHVHVTGIHQFQSEMVKLTCVPTHFRYVRYV